MKQYLVVRFFQGSVWGHKYLVVPFLTPGTSFAQGVGMGSYETVHGGSFV